MNIPARYCTGYLGDIGVPPPYARWTSLLGSRPSSAGSWHIFDARNNIPAHRQSVDCAWPRRFRRRHQQYVRPNTLTSFKVWTEEVRAVESCLPGSRRADAVCVTRAVRGTSSPAMRQPATRMQGRRQPRHRGPEKHPPECGRGGSVALHEAVAPRIGDGSHPDS